MRRGPQLEFLSIEPDFVVVLEDGTNRLVETKRREDPDIQHKDRATELWCENATALTGVKWRYLKVPRSGFDSLQPTDFADLAVFDKEPTEFRYPGAR